MLLKQVGIFLILNFSSYVFATDLITPASQWRYYDSSHPVATTWFLSDFNDAQWLIGNGQFGYGEGDEKTVTSFGNDPDNKPLIQYFRHKFSVKNIEQITKLKMHLLVDDGALIFINDKEVYRINLNSDVKPPTQAIKTLVEYVWTEVELEKSILQNGENTISVAVYQISPDSSDISFDLALSASN